jgi:hypothetical protein
MLETLMPAVIGLAGALIGAIGSTAAIFVQSRHQLAAQRLQMAVEMAVAEHATIVEIGRTHPGGSEIPPMHLFVHHNLAFLRIAETRSPTPEDMRKIANDIDALHQVASELTAPHRSRR